jgi:hypothetical protein
MFSATVRKVDPQIRLQNLESPFLAAAIRDVSQRRFQRTSILSPANSWWFFGSYWASVSLLHGGQKRQLDAPPRVIFVVQG